MADKKRQLLRNKLCRAEASQSVSGSFFQIAKDRVAVCASNLVYSPINAFLDPLSNFPPNGVLL